MELSTILLLGAGFACVGIVVYAFKNFMMGGQAFDLEDEEVGPEVIPTVAAGIQDPMLGVAAYTAGKAAAKPKRKRKCRHCGRIYLDGDGCDCGFDEFDDPFLDDLLAAGLILDAMSDPAGIDMIPDGTPDGPRDGKPDTDGYQGSPPVEHHYTEPEAPAEPTPVFSHHEYSAPEPSYSAPEPSHNSGFSRSDYGESHSSGFSHSDYGSSHSDSPASSYSDSGSSSSSCSDCGSCGCD